MFTDFSCYRNLKNVRCAARYEYIKLQIQIPQLIQQFEIFIILVSWNLIFFFLRLKKNHKITFIFLKYCFQTFLLKGLYIFVSSSEDSIFERNFDFPLPSIFTFPFIDLRNQSIMPWEPKLLMALQRTQ